MINRSIEKTMNQKKIHLLVIDDHQTRYNKILELLKENKHEVVAILLDDLESFEKKIQSEWDLVLFGRAYDLKIDQTLNIIQKSNFPELPCLILENETDQHEHQHVLSQLDVFDRLNINNTDQFYTNIIRAIHFSRVLQEKNVLSAQLDAMSSRIHTANEDQSDQASLVVQEGIIVEANQTVKDIFNMDDIDGFPLLDFLQPKDLDHFKTAFKAASLATLETSYIEIESDHENLSLKNPLSLKVFSDLNSDDIHVHISESQNIEINSQNTVLCSYEVLKNNIPLDSVNTYLLVALDLDPSAYPAILNLNLFETDQYIRELSKHIEYFFAGSLIQLSPCAWIGIITAQSIDDLNSKKERLEQLRSLSIQITNDINTNTSLVFGVTEFNNPFNSQEELDVLYLEAKADQLETHVNSFVEPQQNSKNILELPEDYAAISSSEIQLSHDGFAETVSPIKDEPLEVYYQQIYDKEDTQLNLYGLSSNIHHQIPQVISNDESILIDQQTLEKAFKQLREHIASSPDTIFIVSLHTAMIQQNSLLSYLSELSQFFDYSSHPHSVVLQFKLNEIQQYQLENHPIWDSLKSQGIDIAIDEFSLDQNHLNLIEHIKPIFCSVNIKLSELEKYGITLDQLQEQLDEYKDHYPNTAFILPKLDDMNDFADAWNVDIRYLQGSYFHKKIIIA